MGLCESADPVQASRAQGFSQWCGLPPQGANMWVPVQAHTLHATMWMCAGSGNSSQSTDSLLVRTGFRLQKVYLCGLLKMILGHSSICRYSMICLVTFLPSFGELSSTPLMRSESSFRRGTSTMYPSYVGTQLPLLYIWLAAVGMEPICPVYFRREALEWCLLQRNALWMQISREIRCIWPASARHCLYVSWDAGPHFVVEWDSVNSHPIVTNKTH